MDIKKLKDSYWIFFIFLAVVLIFLVKFQSCNCDYVYKEFYMTSNLNIDSKKLFSEIPNIGNGNIYVLEFTDPECPFTRLFFGDKDMVNYIENRTNRNYNPGRKYLLNLVEENKIKLYSIEFPLNIHPNSLNISTMLYCIYKKEGNLKYFQIKEMVYTDKKYLDYFMNNIDKNCLKEYRSKVLNYEMFFSNVFGIRGTPSLVFIIKNPDYKRYLKLYKYALRNGGYGMIAKVDGEETLIIMIPGAISSDTLRSLI